MNPFKKILSFFSPVKARMSQFEAVYAGRRLRAWRATNEHINSLLQGGAETLRNRSRQMCRDNPYASNAAESFVASLIGTGVNPSLIVKKGGPISKELKKEINELWYDWVEEADADGTVDFAGMQTLIARAVFESGEAFVRIRPRLSVDGLTVPFQLQVLESDQLPMNFQWIQPNGNQVRCGIEFDRIGRRVAYHFLKSHPGDSTDQKNDGERTRVSASEILHIFPVQRPGQIRGTPRMVSSLVKMYVLDQYDDAELDRKKIAALFAFFITSPEEETGGEASKMFADEDDDGVLPLQPGTGQKLRPGEDVRFSEPAEVGGSYEAFQYRTLMQISAGLGMPYTSVTGDLRQVNYSSIRTGLIEFQRRLRQLLFNTVVFQFCRPVWQYWVETAVLNGSIKNVDRSLLKKLQRRINWIPPKWDWVDPYKEAQATRIMIRAGMISRDTAIEQLGLDPDEVDEIQAAGNLRADELGLAYDSDPRRTSNAGVGQDGRANLPGEDETEEKPSGMRIVAHE